MPIWSTGWPGSSLAASRWAWVSRSPNPSPCCPSIAQPASAAWISAARSASASRPANASTGTVAGVARTAARVSSSAAAATAAAW
jgi:hypothetical protein